MHTRDMVAEQFIADVTKEVKEIMKNPGKPIEGKMAIYGVAQTIPDRALVGDITRCFLDSMYYTPVQDQKWVLSSRQNQVHFNILQLKATVINFTKYTMKSPYCCLDVNILWNEFIDIFL